MSEEQEVNLVQEVRNELEEIDVEAISRRTGALSGCSGCEWDILEILKTLSEH